MGFLHLFIVNKSGGLIHHRPLGPKAPRIGTNEWLRIGSTFHSLHAIAAEASPLKLPGNKNASTFTTKSRYSRALLDVLDNLLVNFFKFVSYKYTNTHVHSNVTLQSVLMMESSKFRQVVWSYGAFKRELASSLS
jgi:hypothetical protein